MTCPSCGSTERAVRLQIDRFPYVMCRHTWHDVEVEFNADGYLVPVQDECPKLQSRIEELEATVRQHAEYAGSLERELSGHRKALQKVITEHEGDYASLQEARGLLEQVSYLAETSFRGHGVTPQWVRQYVDPFLSSTKGDPTDG